MPVSTAQIEGVAKHLLNPGTLPLDTEASIRSGASRAYYAAMLAVRDAVQIRTGFMYSNSGLCRYLKEHQQSSVRAVGYKLAAFKRKRQIADYDIADPVSLPDLKASLSDGQQILTLLARAVPNL